MAEEKWVQRGGQAGVGVDYWRVLESSVGTDNTRVRFKHGHRQECILGSVILIPWKTWYRLEQTIVCTYNQPISMHQRNNKKKTKNTAVKKTERRKNKCKWRKRGKKDGSTGWVHNRQNNRHSGQDLMNRNYTSTIDGVLVHKDTQEDKSGLL